MRRRGLLLFRMGRQYIFGRMTGLGLRGHRGEILGIQLTLPGRSWRIFPTGQDGAQYVSRIAGRFAGCLRLDGRLQNRASPS